MDEFLIKQVEWYKDGDFLYYYTSKGFGFVLMDVSKYVLDKEFFENTNSFIGFKLTDNIRLVTDQVSNVFYKMTQTNREGLLFVLIDEGTYKVITDAKWLLDLFDPYLLEEVYNV